MFKISTYFIKEQVPGLTKLDLIDRYKREFEIQNANNICIDRDRINFSNNNFKFVINRFSNKFSSFSRGQIEIIDEGDEFGIYFEANWSRLFTSAGIAGGIASLLSLAESGLNIFPLVFGLFIFILLIAIGFISTSISFPVYFTSLRNNIEKELREGNQ